MLQPIKDLGEQLGREIRAESFDFASCIPSFDFEVEGEQVVYQTGMLPYAFHDIWPSYKCVPVIYQSMKTLTSEQICCEQTTETACTLVQDSARKYNTRKAKMDALWEGHTKEG